MNSTVIWGLLQLFLLIASQIMRQGEEDRKKKQELHNEVKDAIKSGDGDRINSIILKLRQ